MALTEQWVQENYEQVSSDLYVHKGFTSALTSDTWDLWMGCSAKEGGGYHGPIRWIQAEFVINWSSLNWLLGKSKVTRTIADTAGKLMALMGFPAYLGYYVFKSTTEKNVYRFDLGFLPPVASMSGFGFAVSAAMISAILLLASAGYVLYGSAAWIRSIRTPASALADAPKDTWGERLKSLKDVMLLGAVLVVAVQVLPSLMKKD